MDSGKVTGKRDRWGWGWEERVDTASDEWTDTCSRKRRGEKNNVAGKKVEKR